MTFVAMLQPTPLWRHFDTILTIPRGSKNEERMCHYIVEVAQRHGLDHQMDDAGNMVVRKPGSAGHESAPITILQSHLDMVNEKNANVEHDFMTDPIIPRMNGDYLTATGTTLGSDNGIGVATMLALMEPADLIHGPLELLFTIDEETGLTGALQLDVRLLRGRQLINLDSEEDGIVYVGCAGGADSTLTLGLSTARTASSTLTINIALRGLKGGHSGCDIHLQRANAVKLLARTLAAARRNISFRLASFEGGSAHNAIPREACACVVIDTNARNELLAAVKAEFTAIQDEYRPADPAMQLTVNEVPQLDDAWDKETSETVLRLVNGLPHGVVTMSHDIPGLVETSTNLATVKSHDGSLHVGLSSRSSLDSALEALQDRIRSIGLLAGAMVKESASYPGWKPNLKSRLLQVIKTVQRDTFGGDPEVKAIHAGLECGIIGKKVSGMEMVSFGPRIEFPHSPDEQVHVESVERFYRLAVATLKALA